ncbi:uncharacterized protein Sfp93F [Chelonus insularis]|uniref:uncharacterized protein Sfp93F n=1 Tax=Chelonus insularis TaxID=460826 RepID=UPI001588EE53|nr:uncharacterized protein LOC118066142 [Chelonus insularis]
MSFKTCLFLVIFSLVVMMIATDSRMCLRNGQKCYSHDSCCSKMCQPMRHFCIPGQALAAPPGFRAPMRPIPPQEPGQSNCAGYGSSCHSTNCCAPYRCGNFGLKCVY